MTNSNNLLEQLFGVKAKVLKLFLQHPQLVLSVGDITKRTNIKKAETKKLVFYFIKMGFLKKSNGNDLKLKVPKNRVRRG
ncbi:MAG: hypothetical protein Q8Q95_04110 [bacterium]|nr:hypothetical protein [bacterium]